MALWSGLDFKNTSRVSRRTSNSILGRVSHRLEADPDAFGPPPISPDITLASTIWYLANGASIKQVAQQFDIEVSTFHDIRDLVTNAIVAELMEEFVSDRMPKKDAEADVLVDKMFQLAGFPGVIGAGDGRGVRQSPWRAP